MPTACPILDRIRTTDDLPTLPMVAVEVLRLSRDAEASMDDLVRLLEADPALTAKLLKVVNSALFGMPRSVKSVRQAMTLLGWRAVRVMVLSFSLVDSMDRSAPEGERTPFDFEAYWRRSLTTAVATRLLAKVVKPHLTEDAFVAGLLANIGRLAAVRCAPDLYGPVLEEVAKGQVSLHDVELELLGVTHALMGRELLTIWGLPEEVCAAIGAHLGERIDELVGPPAELALIVQSGALIAGAFCQDLPCTDLDTVKRLCIQQTRITEPALEKLLEELDSIVREAASLLAVSIGQTFDYARLQIEAAGRLSALSLEAEVERMQSVKREAKATQQAARLVEENQAILQSAATDSLTGLANRAAFDERLRELIGGALRGGRAIGLLMADLDDFKPLNDEHGHQAGDKALRIVGALLRHIVGEEGFAARYGGEEFVVIVDDPQPLAFSQLADRIRAGIEMTPAPYQGKQLRMTASVGGVRMQRVCAGLTPERLIELADGRLYEAKRSGRNRVVIQMIDSSGATQAA